MSAKYHGQVEKVTSYSRFTYVCDGCGREVEEREGWLILTWPELDEHDYGPASELESPADLCSPDCAVAFITKATRALELAAS